MRCSDCFSEMKQGPDGLVCTACGTTLAPLIDDAQAALPPPLPSSNRSWLKWAGAGVALLAVAIIAGTLALSETARGWLQSAFPADPAPMTSGPSVIEDDPSNLIVNALSLEQTGQSRKLFAGLTCQSVPSPSESQTATLEWVAFGAETTAKLSPALPQNWTLLEICRDRSGLVIASASLADGVAISKIDPDGGAAWMRILPVPPGRVEDAKLYLTNDQIMVLSPSSLPANFALAAYSLDGEQLFERAVPNVARGAQPVLTTSSVGDTVLAWAPETSDLGVPLRLRALSPQNTINYDIDLLDRSVPVAAAISDDLARTLLIEGRNGFSAQFVDAAGEPVWRRWVDPDAMPIGVVMDGPDFIVAALKDQSLALWRLREDGTRSEPVTTRLSGDIESARLSPAEMGRASVLIDFLDGERALITVDLDRVPDEAGEETIVQPGLRDALLEDLEQAEPVQETVEAAQPVQPVPERRVEASNITPLPATDIAPPPAAPVAADPSQQSPRPEPEPREAATEAASNPIQPIQTPVIREASCTFRCVAIGNAAATYPIMQTIALDEGEALSVLPDRLGPTHKKLCEVSGGQLVVESRPECAAR